MSTKQAMKSSTSQKTKPQYTRVSVPLYGPLDIENPEEFMIKQKEIFQKCFPMPCPGQKAVEDFEPITLLGEGGFGKVYLVMYKNTEKFYAMKIMLKKYLVDNDYIGFALNEKRILQSLNFPFCCRLEFLSQDKKRLFYFLPFISGGELLIHLKKFKRFNEELSKFYSAQVILALEFLHFCNLVYRDLKPENILVDHNGFIKVTDFGFTKECKNRLYTFCGTPEYIAPEIILGLGHSKAADYWSLGVLIYELVYGKTPFHSETDMETFKKIVIPQYEMPKIFSKALQDLIIHLLQSDTTQRFGNLQNGVNDLKRHSWFEEINWLNVLNRKINPPYVPAVKKVADLARYSSTDDVKNIFNESDTDENYDKYFVDF